MQKKPKKIRRHIFIAVPVDNYLKRLAKQHNMSVGEVVDVIVQEHKDAKRTR